MKLYLKALKRYRTKYEKPFQKTKRNKSNLVEHPIGKRENDKR